MDGTSLSFPWKRVDIAKRGRLQEGSISINFFLHIISFIFYKINKHIPEHNLILSKIKSKILKDYTKKQLDTISLTTGKVLLKNLSLGKKIKSYKNKLKYLKNHENNSTFNKITPNKKDNVYKMIGYNNCYLVYKILKRIAIENFSHNGKAYNFYNEIELKSYIKSLKKNKSLIKINKNKI